MLSLFFFFFLPHPLISSVHWLGSWIHGEEAADPGKLCPFSRMLKAALLLEQTPQEKTLVAVNRHCSEEQPATPKCGAEDVKAHPGFGPYDLWGQSVATPKLLPDASFTRSRQYPQV